MADCLWSERARLPLFAPLAGLLNSFPDGRFPDTDVLNGRMAAAHIRTTAGRALRFVPPCQDGLGYEARIHSEGAIAHRPDHLHDFFNALVWLRFPLAKAALSARHGRALETAATRARGPVRDALTQFDECGVLVLSSDSSLSALLSAHRWKEAFWQRRQDLLVRTRFIVFGHALYEQLHAPFVGLCGKALYWQVEQASLELPLDQQLAPLDARLAEWLAQQLQSPRDLKPLPLLGIPGVVTENSAAAYYDDVRQFRPLRAARSSGPISPYAPSSL